MNIASANVELQFANFVITELIFTDTGNPQTFDGCFEIFTEFHGIGTSDSSLGGALPVGVVGMIGDSDQSIVVRLTSFIFYLRVDFVI